MGGEGKGMNEMEGKEERREWQERRAWRGGERRGRLNREGRGARADERNHFVFHLP
jgi:hypothetical protein